MKVKYVRLIVIGDKNKTKTEDKYFITKSSYIRYIRRNKDIVLFTPMARDTQDQKLMLSLEELLEMEWNRI